VFGPLFSPDAETDVPLRPFAPNGCCTLDGRSDKAILTAYLGVIAAQRHARPIASAREWLRSVGIWKGSLNVTAREIRAGILHAQAIVAKFPAYTCPICRETRYVVSKPDRNAWRKPDRNAWRKRKAA
jgi:hypothetical protein